MITKKSAIEILSGLKPQLEKQYLVQSIAIFGSFARGEQHEGSDIDILVDVDASLGLNFIRLAETLEKELGIHVDLVSSRALKPRYRDIVNQECIYV